MKGDLSMQLSNVIKKDLLYGGLTREEYYSIKNTVNEEDRKNNISHSIVTLLFWVVAFIIYGPGHYSSLMRVFPYGYS